MAELARGTVADRPWGLTMGALGMRGLSGQLALVADGKRYLIAFTRGAVVGAASPLASDAAVRVALTGGLLSSTQVADVARRQAAAPQRDEIEVIAEHVRLAPDQALKLRRRTIAQRAARTFSIERGDFLIDDQITLPLFPGTELDVRSVIYLGARQNLSETRLDAELARLGRWFRLKPDAEEDLPQFGFSQTEGIVVERLRSGASLEDLDDCGIDVRTVHAALYALISCNACEIDTPVPVAAMRSAVPVPTTTAEGSSRVSMPAPPPPSAVATIRGSVHADAVDLVPARPTPVPKRRSETIDVPTIATRRRAGTSRPPVTSQRRKTETTQAVDVKALITQRLEMLGAGADFFALLGVANEAAPSDIRKAYFALARQLHPDRLSALNIPDEAREAQRLFAQVNTAFAVLSDPKRRHDYVQILRRGGDAAVRAEQAKAEQMATRIMEAEEAYRRGGLALRRDQLSSAITEFARAMELNPDEADYEALHAWSQFCAAPDKMAIAKATRTALDRAMTKSPRAVTARFYLGRVERMLGRDPEALKHFQEVLRIQPHHADAASEARVIEARLAGGSGDKPGLFNRKR